MTTLVKFIIVAIISFFMVSCNNIDIDISRVKGNGKVVTEKRLQGDSFNRIKAGEGLEVFLTQSTENTVKVQADENLQDIIITEIKDDVLHIHTKKNIGKAEAKKVIVNFKDVNAISSSSGSRVRGTNKITSEDLSLSASSGSDLALTVYAANVDCSASSGAAITVRGKSNDLTAKASSGSNIDAEKLASKNCTAKVSSGARIETNCSSSLSPKASSGGTITYKGEPKLIDVSTSSSGSLRNKN